MILYSINKYNEYEWSFISYVGAKNYESLMIFPKILCIKVNYNLKEMWVYTFK